MGERGILEFRAVTGVNLDKLSRFTRVTLNLLNLVWHGHRIKVGKLGTGGG